MPAKTLLPKYKADPVVPKHAQTELVRFALHQAQRPHQLLPVHQSWHRPLRLKPVTFRLGQRTRRLQRTCKISYRQGRRSLAPQMLLEMKLSLHARVHWNKEGKISRKWTLFLRNASKLTKRDWCC